MRPSGQTGYRCRALHKLWTFYTAPGFSTELLHLYVAEGLTPGDAQPEADETIDVRVFDVEEAWSMIERDEIPDAKTQATIHAMTAAKPM